ncbi:hypothetical protein Hanom_Chr08g00707071 [Helianthus anomalus]
MLRLARLSSRYYAGGASNIRSYAAAASKSYYDFMSVKSELLFIYLLLMNYLWIS